MSVPDEPVQNVDPEEPEFEIPVAQSILKKYNPLRKTKRKTIPFFSNINPCH